MSNTNKDQIEDVITRWAKAVKNKDLEGVIANHAEEIVMFDVDPPLQKKELMSTQMYGRRSFLSLETMENST